MEVIHEVATVRQYIRVARQRGCRIGCVPTMGALHPGHLSLVEECRKHVDEVVVTIFVNPTQFGPNEDFQKYPRPLEKDLALCRENGVAYVFAPGKDSLYPAGFDTWVEVDQLTSMLEGEHRPGHFRGVTTIVCKLLNIVQPDVACFGAKDYQQQAVIRRMVLDLDIPTEILTCPTIREPDGLALSSRNVYLSLEEREIALSLSRALNHVQSAVASGQRDWSQLETEMATQLSSAGVDLQYAVIRHPETLQSVDESPSHVVALIAGYVGKTRLIDNMRIPVA
ncbi:MAG: pantoate--beta-alanine ligase [Planctomycetaceae bacterium]|nr:pantoate--beta-alanine ligase [Planctomycetaceae bacterium]